MDLTAHRLSFLGYNYYLAYRNKKLFMIQFPDNPPNTWMNQDFLKVLPVDEDDIKKVTFFINNKHTGVDISHRELQSAKTAQDKIVLFGMAFKHYRHVAYDAKEKERANVKHVPVNKKLLDTYFNSPGMSNFTLENYIHRINITKDYAANGFPDSRFPNDFDKDLYRKMDATTQREYEQHLVSRGFVRDYHPTRGTIWKQQIS